MKSSHRVFLAAETYKFSLCWSPFGLKPLFYLICSSSTNYLVIILKWCLAYWTRLYFSLKESLLWLQNIIMRLVLKIEISSSLVWYGCLWKEKYSTNDVAMMLKEFQRIDLVTFHQELCFFFPGSWFSLVIIFWIWLQPWIDITVATFHQTRNGEERIHRTSRQLGIGVFHGMCCPFVVLPEFFIFSYHFNFFFF